MLMLHDSIGTLADPERLPEQHNSFLFTSVFPLLFVALNLCILDKVTSFCYQTTKLSSVRTCILTICFSVCAGEVLGLFIWVWPVAMMKPHTWTLLVLHDVPAIADPERLPEQHSFFGTHCIHSWLTSWDFVHLVKLKTLLSGIGLLLWWDHILECLYCFMM